MWLLTTLKKYSPTKTHAAFRKFNITQPQLLPWLSFEPWNQNNAELTPSLHKRSMCGFFSFCFCLQGTFSWHEQRLAKILPALLTSHTTLMTDWPHGGQVLHLRCFLEVLPLWCLWAFSSDKEGKCAGYNPGPSFSSLLPLICLETTSSFSWFCSLWCSYICLHSSCVQ